MVRGKNVCGEPKVLGLEGERYLEVLGPGHPERIPAGRAPSSAAERGLQSALTSLPPPLYTHSCLVLLLRFLPLKFWFLKSFQSCLDSISTLHSEFDSFLEP